MALTFPAAPVVGEIYPPGPGSPGVSQWEWDGFKWVSVPVFVRTNNQESYNSYTWPTSGATAVGYQLTDLLANGVLTWEKGSGNLVYLDDISSQFDDTQNIFTLNKDGFAYSPTPSSNLLIVLGGIVQVPGVSYTISGPTITFSAPPATGAAFVGITNFIE